MTRRRALLLLGKSRGVNGLLRRLAGVSSAPSPSPPSSSFSSSPLPRAPHGTSASAALPPHGVPQGRLPAGAHQLVPGVAREVMQGQPEVARARHFSAESLAASQQQQPEGQGQPPGQPELAGPSGGSQPVDLDFSSQGAALSSNGGGLTRESPGPEGGAGLGLFETLEEIDDGAGKLGGEAGARAGAAVGEALAEAGAYSEHSLGPTEYETQQELWARVRVLPEVRADAARAVRAFQAEQPGRHVSRRTLLTLVRRLKLRRKFQHAFQLCQHIIQDPGMGPPNEMDYKQLLDCMALSKRDHLALETFASFPAAFQTDQVFSGTVIELARRGKVNRVEAKYRWLREYGRVPITSCTFNTRMHALGQRGLLRELDGVLAEMVAQGIEPDLLTYRVLLSAYGRAGQLAAMEDRWRECEARGFQLDEIAYNIIADSYFRAGQVARAEEAYEKQLRVGVTPRGKTHTTRLWAYAELGDIEKLEEVWRECSVSSVRNGWLALARVHGYGKVGRVDEAEKIFRDMEARGLLPVTASYNVLLEAYCRNGLAEKADALLREMDGNRMRRNSKTHSTLMRAWLSLGDEARLFRDLEVAGRQGPGARPTVPTVLSVAQHFAEAGRPEAVDRALRAVARMGIISGRASFARIVAHVNAAADRGLAGVARVRRRRGEGEEEEEAGRPQQESSWQPWRWEAEASATAAAAANNSTLAAGQLARSADLETEGGPGGPAAERPGSGDVPAGDGSVADDGVNGRRLGLKESATISVSGEQEKGEAEEKGRAALREGASDGGEELAALEQKIVGILVQMKLANLYKEASVSPFLSAIGFSRLLPKRASRPPPEETEDAAAVESS